MNNLIAVVIPTYKVKEHILSVISSIGDEVSLIIIVDDACPEYSGQFVRNNCNDPRLKILFNEHNLGVGGAVLEGYKLALSEGMSLIVKIDGDGQMDPNLLTNFTNPILNGEADYTKGNRFFDIEGVRLMPPMRIIGNTVLSFMSKLSSGYWDIFDPTNGFTAIHANVARCLPFNKVSKRYFFETDMLFRLGTLRARVVDIPMQAKYGDEKSNLKITSIIFEFFIKHLINSFKRIFYNYYLRDLSIASIELPIGFSLFIFGVFYGSTAWIDALETGVSAPVGTIMLSALTTLAGLQLLLAFLSFDIISVPKKSIHQLLNQKF